MDYPKKVAKLLKESEIEVGDIITISSEKGVYKGILMPHHEASCEDILTIKLDNGYNIGISVNDESRIFLVERAAKLVGKENKLDFDESKPQITVLGTGGTIASYIDYRTGAVHPALNTEDLAYSVPELAEICNIKAKVLFSMFSEDLTLEHWQKLAKEAALELNSGAEGVIVAHGTDTMGYTSSALSFMLRNLTSPVILIGSQRSSDRPSTDSRLNLISAAQLAVNSDLGEVVVMMHGNTSDSHVVIHRGTKVRKMHASRRGAFCSINEKPLGTVKEGIIEISGSYRKRGKDSVEVLEKMEEKVCLIYTYPGIKAALIDYLAEKNMGIVIAGTGLGHAANQMIESIRNAISNGVYVVMTSQCFYGRVNMNVYSTGRDLMRVGVISGEDMLPETAFVKLMWVLGQTQDPEEVKALITTNLVGEIGVKRELSGPFQSYV
ncbi:MAG: Glu-tRNA(Gln) amidotransferase subunit GatD [Thermoplasmata archaeon]|nr:MAG: Glu-tRNA(Gln) amidotransferase subunit GatD [Thermoplasmata archaeon]